jgi:hypothetical protein
VFYGKADTWHLMGFYVFQVCVPGHTGRQHCLATRYLQFRVWVRLEVQPKKPNPKPSCMPGVLAEHLLPHS